ncbi:MAG: linear amide C-N hydrolase, partial [Clostridia bacterium]|nr:linear amide C-N hydrolase [Clostridia bacterium]
MCTVVSCRAGSHFFGRTLDYDRSFGETIVITPRNYPFPFRCLPSVPGHHAM